MRLAYYAGASTAAAAACLLKAFHQRPNFYSATVYLSQSNACLLVLTNLLLVIACTFIYALQRLLYGPLRPIEIEQLSEKAWYAVLDTLLAMPSFREDVGGWLLTMFVLLLAGKVWGWIGEGRVDILEQQPPANPRLFHARLASSLIFSVAFDVYMLKFCVESVIADPRPGMMVIFTFEFAILLIFSLFTLLRYQLTVIETHITKEQTKQAIERRKEEIRIEMAAAAAAEELPTPSADVPIEVDENEVDVPGWEEKRRYLFALEVLTDFVKLMIYVAFFTVSVTFNGLPMHIMRDVYMTFASFSKRVADYIAYRKATSDMNSRYPDATTEEIRGDACIVCRESMVAWEQNADQAAQQQDGQVAPQAPPVRPQRRDEGLRAKKLPCGHILHLRCLKAWLERQQVCPTCRRPVVSAAPSAPTGAAAAPGANQDPAQQAQQQNLRNRARFFNLGRLRIGFVRGRAGQLQNMINQFNNQEPANQNGVQPAQQQGPNHLGLQVPYADAAQQGGQANAANGTRRRVHVPLQVQLMQIEQRLVQQAHNLGVEQRQLATIRMMEAELARLRAQHISSRSSAGLSQGGRSDGQQYSWPAPQSHDDLALNHAITPPVMLHGNATQPHNAGHADLPTGLTLPEGWTAIPLRAVPSATPAQTQVAAAPILPPPELQSLNPTQVESVNRTPPANGEITADVAPGVSVSQTETPATGPTDDTGIPYFVPVQRTDGDHPSPVAASGSQEVTSVSNDVQATSTAPWQNQGSWGFTQPSDTAAVPDAAATAPHASEDSTSAQDAGAQDKGKGRAVEVEDVDDTGS